MRYLRGLEQSVTFHKDLRRGYWVGLEDGRNVQQSYARFADRAGWRAAHGALSPALADHVDALSADGTTTTVPVLVRLRGTEPAATDSAVENLAALGLEVVFRSATAPFVTGHASVEAVQVLAREPEIAAIYAAYGGTPVEHAQSVFSSEFHNVKPFHQEGITGKGISVGVVDLGSCRLRADHVSVAGRVEYTAPGFYGDACQSSGDCKDHCGYCGSAGFCISTHGTSVAGVIGDVAPEATIVYATDFRDVPGETFKSVGCSPQGITEAYDWFALKGVPVVAESFTCNDNFHISELDGVIQDYHSWRSNILVTKASGNNKACPESGLCPACLDTLNSVCVGGVNYSKEMSCFSQWNNPEPSGHQTDREEPDVVAYAGDGGPIWVCKGFEQDRVLVADATTTNDYKEEAGTSFASPAIAAQAALMLSECAKNKIAPPTSTGLRALLRNNAVAANPEGPRYSTNKGVSATDHRDGGGMYSLGSGWDYCDPTSGGDDLVIFDDDPSFDPVNGGEPDPLFPIGEPIFGGDPPESKALIQNPPPGWESGYSWKQYPKLQVHEGARIRATFSWQGCADDPDPSSTNARYPGIDYDLYLIWDDGGSIPYYSSQTLDDVNEGFDVDILPGYGGTYRLIVVWPTVTDLPCRGVQRVALSFVCANGCAYAQ